MSRTSGTTRGPGLSTNSELLAKATVGQATEILDLQNSDGTHLLQIAPVTNGVWGQFSAHTSAYVIVEADDTLAKLQVKGAAGQTNPLLELRDSTNTTVFSVMLDGTVFSAKRLPFSLAIATKTAAYTLTAADSVILANGGTGANNTMTLPSAVTVGAGIPFLVKNINATAATVKAVAGTIDGVAAATGVTLAQYEAKWFISDGANWNVI